MKKVIALFVDGLSVPAKEGLTAHYTELAEHLAASSNWQPLMIVADRGRATQDTLQAQPYDTVLLPAEDYYDKNKIDRLLMRYNVVIAQNYNPHYFSTILAPAARKCGVSTVFEVHDYEKDLEFMNRNDEETVINIEAQRVSIREATHTRIMSRYDYEQIMAKYDHIPEERISWLPFAANRSNIIKQSDSRQVLFIGNSSYPPNADACRYIIEELAPRMLDVSFHLVGRETDKLSTGPNVMAHGEVDDLEPWLEKAAVGIAPLAMGSGMKIKLLKYLSAGIPCVASTVAVSGFPHDERAISIADTPADFVKAIYEKLSDREASKFAERYFTSYFDAEKMFASIERMYEAVLATSCTWDAPEAGEFDPERLHWLKEAANACFGKAVQRETYIRGCVERHAKPVVVIEGLPGAGKTSLINELRKYSPTVGFVEEVPFAITSGNESDYYKNDIVKQQLAETLSAEYIVMDRNYCSTLAYAYAESRVSGDNSIYDRAEAWIAEKLKAGVFKRPAAYIYIDIDPKLSIARRSKRSADWKDEQFARYVAEWYESYFKELVGCPTLSYDAKIPTMELARALEQEQQLRRLTISTSML